MFNKTVIIFSLLSLALGLLFSLVNSSLEFFFLDLRFLQASRKYRQFDFSEHLVIIAIDQYSEQQLGIPIEGKGWRQYDSRVINILVTAGATVIACDIQYSHEKTPWDEQLAASYRNAGWVITGEEEEGSTLPLLRKELYATANPAITTIAGIPRKVYKFAGSSPRYTMPFATLDAYAVFQQQAGISLVDGRQLAEQLDSLDGYWINYQYPVSYFPVFSYVHVLNSAGGRLGNPERTGLAIFKNKIVIIAKDFPKDRIRLPHLSGVEYFGGLVHCYAVESFLENAAVKQAPFYFPLLAAMLAILIVQLAFTRLNHLPRTLLLLAFFLFYWLLGTVLFENFNVWLNYAGFFSSALFMVIFNISYRRRLLARNFQRVKKEISRLEEYNNLLEEAAEMRDILTDTIVHDIKNSIAAVEGSLLYVTEKYKNDQYTLQTFHAANLACQDIINLSSNLLDVRKIEEGEMDFQNQICPYPEIIEIINRFVEYPVFHEKKLRVEVIPPDFKAELHADRYLLEQIIHNLLHNSMKYTPAGGYLKVTFQQTAEEIIFIFFNSGIPISDQQKEMIFNKYIRLGKERSRYSKGLGLYFCRMAMGIHNGRIWLDTDTDGNYFKLGFRLKI